MVSARAAYLWCLYGALDGLASRGGAIHRPAVAFILAIDGPAGAGKSTVSKRVADRLGFVLVDTGAIYRSAALLAMRKGLEEERAIASAVLAADIWLDGSMVMLDGEDISSQIRTPEVSRHASVVSALPAVRAALLDRQRIEARRQPSGAVVEGRDIGTVVFPDADAKIFLTASLEARAERRTAELEKKGMRPSHADVMAEISIRDARDSERAVAPLKAAADARRVDTTGKSIDEVVEEIASYVASKRL